ncbi:MAG: DUF1499 domain-containing protein [Candidatus Wallbacteria bacterium]|nr:DUF1499 domain-containing protein [Candidatus Wallbacteria bacterium]
MATDWLLSRLAGAALAAACAGPALAHGGLVRPLVGFVACLAGVGGGVLVLLAGMAVVAAGKAPASSKPLVLQAYPQVRPLLRQASPDRAFQEALELARAQPDWELGTIDADARTLCAVVRSKLFRFADDVAVRVKAEGKGSRVDMRSRSRDGRGDFGVNAARIVRFLATLSTR